MQTTMNLPDSLMQQVRKRAESDRRTVTSVPIRDQPPTPRIGFMPEITVPDDFDQMGSAAIVSLFGAP